MSIFDITLPVSSALPVWPGDPAIHFYRIADVNTGDMCTLSRLDSGSHLGTHLDAPRHFIKNGQPVDQLDLSVLIGPCRVVHVPDAEVIDAALLDTLHLPADTTRLLFRTRNSDIWARADSGIFRTDYVGIDPSGAEWIVERGLRLVGIDYMSIAPFADTIRPHQILLGAGVIAVENLNLSGIRPGAYQLICLPLKLQDGDGAPARVVLLRDE